MRVTSTTSTPRGGTVRAFPAVSRIANGISFARSTGPCTRSVRSSALNTNDGTLCCFKAHYEKLFRVGFPETLPAYLDDLESRITRFDLPLGASVDTRAGGEIVLQVRTSPCANGQAFAIQADAAVNFWPALWIRGCNTTLRAASAPSQPRASAGAQGHFYGSVHLSNEHACDLEAWRKGC
jgi:hypothetical protein